MGFFKKIFDQCVDICILILIVTVLSMFELFSWFSKSVKRDKEIFLSND